MEIKKLNRAKKDRYRVARKTNEYAAVFNRAGLNEGEIMRINKELSNSIMFVGKGWTPTKKSTVDNSVKTTQIFKKLLDNNLFSDLNNLNNLVKEGTNKTSTGSQLINSVTKLDKIRFNALRDKQSQDFQDLSQAVKNFENIYKNGGNLVSYDLETLGGVNSAGHQQTDFITEFSVTVRNLKGKNNIELPKREAFKTQEEWTKALIDTMAPIDEKRSVSSLFGFSDEEYKQLHDYISSLKGKTQLNGRDSVYLKRLSMMTDKNLKLDKSNGFFVNITQASSDYKVSIDDALEGLKKYKEITDHQMQWMKAHNITKSYAEYRQEMIQKLSNFVNNGVDFDGNPLSNFVTLGHNIKNFDNNVLRVLGGDEATLKAGYFEPKPGTMLDTYQIVKASEQFVGLDSHIPAQLKVAKEFGTGTQDALKNAFNVVSDVTAHNAQEDERSLANMLFTPIAGSKKGTTLGEHFIGLMNKAEEAKFNEKSIHEFKDRKGVFLMTSTPGANKDTNALGFTYHPADNSFKSFDGHRIKLDNGEIVKDSYAQWGPKRDALYTMDAFELDINSDKWNEILDQQGFSKLEKEQFYQSYKNVGKLHVARMQEYISDEELAKRFKDPDVVRKNLPVHYVITPDKDFISNSINRVGYINNEDTAEESIDFIQKSLDKLDYKVTTMEDGKVKVVKEDSELLKKRLIKNSSARTQFESVARDIRDNNPVKLLKANEFRKANNGLEISSILSKMVASEKTLDMSKTSQLIDILGYYDYKDGVKKISPESFTKAAVQDEVTNIFSDFFDTLSDTFEKNGLSNIFQTTEVTNPLDKTQKLKAIKSAGNNSNLVKYKMAYERAMDMLFERMEQIKPQFKDLVSSPALMTSRDLNAIDFDTFEIFDKPNKLYEGFRGKNSRYATVRLEDRNSLLKTFFEGKYGTDVDLDMNGPAGANALLDAYETINNDVRFKGKNVFGDIDKRYIEEYVSGNYNIQELGHRMQNNLLKSLQKEDKGYGLLFERRVSDLTKDAEGLKIFMNHYGSKELYEEIATKAVNSIPKDLQIIDPNNSEMVDKLVNNYFMNFSDDDFLKSISGLGKEEKDYALNMYKYAKQDARGLAEDVLKATNRIQDGKLIIHGQGKNKALYLLGSDGTLNNLNAYNYNLLNGSLVTKVGDDFYNVNLGLNTSDYIKKHAREKGSFDIRTDLKISTVTQRHRDRVGSLDKKVERALKNKKDGAEALVYSLNKLSNDMREFTPRVEHYNYTNLVARQFLFDTNDIATVFPELRGHIEKISQDYGVSGDNIRIMNDFLDNLEKNLETKGRLKNSKEMLTIDRNAFFKSYLGPMFDLLNENFEGSDIEIGGQTFKNVASAVKYLNTRGKGTDVEDMKFMSITNPLFDPFGNFDNQARPPVHQQANTVMYNKKEAKESLDELTKLTKDLGFTTKSLEEASLGNKAATSKSYRYIKAFGEQGSGATLKTLQMDSYSLKSVFMQDIIAANNEDVNNKFYKALKKAYKDDPSVTEEELKRRAKVLANKAKEATTYEQQSIIDSRVATAFFANENKKVIKGKNRLLDEHVSNLETIKDVKVDNAKLIPIIANDGTITYQIGENVDSKQLLGVFGDKGVKKYSRDAGIIRGRYTDEYDNIVSEGRLTEFVQKRMKEKGLTSLTTEDKFDMIQDLEDQFVFNYEVIRKNASGGKKLFNGASEKSTATSLALKVGELDPENLNRLKKLGLLDKSEELSDAYFSTILEGIDSKVKAGVISEVEASNLKKSLLVEKHMLSMSYSEFGLFGKNGVSMIAAFNTAKHSSATIAIQNIIHHDKILNDDELLNKIFGKNYKRVIDDNGESTLITDNIKTIDINREKIESYLSSNKKYSEEDRNEIRKILYGKNLVDAQGNMIDYSLDPNLSPAEKEKLIQEAQEKAVGSIGYNYVTQVYDDPSGIGATNEDVSRLKEERGLLETRLNKLTSEIEETKDKAVIDQLTEEKKKVYNELLSVDRRLETASLDKGLKYTERMDLNLNKIKYSPDTIATLKENLTEDEFIDTFGTVLDMNGNVDEKYIGKSVLQPLIDERRKGLLFEHGDRSLESVKGQAKYKYLVDAYQGTDLNKVSVERAETAYVYKKGVEAINFNNLPGDERHSLVNKMTKDETHGFKLLKVDNRLYDKDNQYLDLDIGGQGNIITKADKNPYTNNIMLKTGLGGDYEYLAISRMPEKHFDDSIIKKQHISSLNTIQNYMKDINSGQYQGKELERKVEGAKRAIDQFKDLQKAEVTGKEGLRGDLSGTRLGSSFVGKAAGINIMSDTDYDAKKFGNLDFGKMTRAERLTAMNSDALSRATFKGKSIIEHYADGKNFDTVFASEKAFEDMGYFDKDYMGKVFKNMDSKIKEEAFEGLASDDQRGAMKRVLSKYGDIMTATRFPEIQEGSDKNALVFLNEGLRENQIQVMGYTGVSAKLDFDGDQFFVAKNQRHGSKDSYLDFVTSNKQDQGLREFAKSQEQHMTIRAVRENRYWEDQVKKQIAKEKRISVSGNDLETIAKDRMIEGKLLAAYTPDGEQTEFDLRNKVGKWKEQIDKAMGDEGMESVTKSIRENYADLGFDNADEAIKDFSQGFMGQLYFNERVAKSSRFAVGETNVTNFKIKDIVANSLDATKEDYDYKANALFDMLYQSEEAIISAKSSVDTIQEANRAKVWNDAAKQLLSGRGNAEEHRRTMVDWLDKNVSGAVDLKYHYESSDYFKSMVRDTLDNKDLTDEQILNLFETNDEAVSKIQKRMANDLVDTIAEVHKVNPNSRKMFDSLSLGYSMAGVIKPTRDVANIEGTSQDYVQKELIDKTDTKSAIKMESKSYTTKLKGENFGEEKDFFDKRFKQAGKEAKEKVMDEVSEAFEQGVKSGGIKNGIAAGVIGLAAGIMAMGFVGGNPAPADTQAMEEAQQAYTPMDGPIQLSDQQVRALQGGNQGYVVNINARTNQGKQNTIQAISNAISNSIPANVNISMNINDNYGNINDRDIETAMEKALNI